MVLPAAVLVMLLSACLTGFAFPQQDGSVWVYWTHLAVFASHLIFFLFFCLFCVVYSLVMEFLLIHLSKSIH